MIGDLQIEFDRIKHEVTAIIQKANPTLEIRDAMIMATAWLGGIELKVRETQNPEERRRLVNEFWTRRNIIEKAIRGYGRSLGNGDLHTEQERRRAMS